MELHGQGGGGEWKGMQLVGVSAQDDEWVCAREQCERHQACMCREGKRKVQPHKGVE